MYKGKYGQSVQLKHSDIYLCVYISETERWAFVRGFCDLRLRIGLLDRPLLSLSSSSTSSFPFAPRRRSKCEQLINLAMALGR